MNLLKSLKLQTKMLAAVGALFAALTIFAIASESIANRNIAVLESTRDKFFPVLEAVDKSIFYLERLRDTLNAAAATGEPDMLDEGEKQAAVIQEGFAKAQGLNAEKAKELERLFSSYYKHANELSGNLARKKVDFGNVLPDIEKMKTGYDEFDKKLKDFRSETYTVFVNAMAAANAGSQSLVSTGRAILASAFVLFIGITIFLKMGIIAPVVRLAGFSKKVSSGEFPRVPKMDGRDEIAVLNNNFSSMILDIEAHNEELNNLVVHGREISSCSSLGKLGEAVNKAFMSTLKVKTDSTILFSSVCFMNSDVQDGYYSIDGNQQPILASRLEASSVQGSSDTWLRVEDPRTKELLALLKVASSERKFSDKDRSVLQALSNNAANAISAIRLEGAMSLIERKTSEIRTVFSTISQGICTINEQMQIGSEYSKYCEQLAGSTDLSGKSLSQVFFKDAGIAGDTLALIETCIGSAVGWPSVFYETNAHVLPREFARETSNGMQYIEVDWVPIINAKDEVERVMVALRDITEIKKLKQAAEIKQHEMKMVDEVLSLPQDRFDEFVSMTHKLFNDIKAMFERPEGLREHDISKLKRDLHTIKGTSRVLGLSLLASSMHVTEDLFFKVENEPSLTYPVHFPEDVTGALEASLGVFKNYLALNEKILARGGAKGAQSGPVQGSKNELVRNVARYCEDYAKQNAALPHSELVRVVQALQAADTLTFAEFVKPMVESCVDLAAHIKKPKPRVLVEADGCYVSSGFSSALSTALTHALRNSVDHGLTQDGQGHITIRAASAAKNRTRVEVFDNGRGLNLDKLLVKGIEAGVVSHGAAESQIADLIFHSGLSTSDSVTEISGRGVGMDAVRHAIREMGGDVWLELEKDRSGASAFRPFKLVIEVPSSLLPVLDRFLRSAEEPQHFKVLPMVS